MKHFYPLKNKPPVGTIVNPNHPLAKGLVGSWLFNEGRGRTAFDSSLHRNTGSLVGDTHFVPGKFGSCLDFDGVGDYVSTGYKPGGNLTLSLWVYPNYLIGNELFAGCHDKLNHRFYVGTNTGQLFWALGDTWTNSSGNTHGMSTGKWYHIIVTGDGSTANYYVDLVLKGSFDYSFLGTSADSMHIAQRNPASGEDALPVNALIDNVMIFNRALSERERKQLHTDPFVMYRETLTIASSAITASLNFFGAII